MRHEAQHASCAQKLGATAVWYALSFCRAEADIFGQVYDIDGAATIAQNFQTTKLGLAILSAYPEQPSEDDLQDVYNLGYKSIDDVANHAIVYNAQGYSYPIPLGRTSNKGL